VLTVMAATDAHRADTHKHIPTIAPLVIGMAVTAAHFIAIPVDNCSINPARCVGSERATSERAAPSRPVRPSARSRHVDPSFLCPLSLTPLVSPRPDPRSTFGVAAISGNFNDHWVFWFGPYLGAIAAALTYNYLFLHEDAVKEAEEEQARLDAARAALAGVSALAPPALAVAKAQPEAVATPIAATPSQEWR